MIVGITINEHDIINFSIKDASGIHRYYEKEAVSNGEELIAIVDGKQIKLREAFHFEMVRQHSKLSKKADEQSKPIGKFKDNAALQKAYESLEKEFTRRSQRLRELQKERENMQAEIIRLNDIKFTQEHCDLYEENEWLKAELKRQLAEHEAFTKQTKAEIERLTKDKSFATRKMMESKAKAVELQTQVDELKEENKTVLNRSTMWKHLHTEVCKENDELQKQVDELLNRKIEPKIIECHGMLKGCDMVNQAVKDTAKEIIQMLKEGVKYGWTKCLDITYEEIKERYGVEAE